MNSWESNNNVVKLYRNHKKNTNCTINFHGGVITSWRVLSVEQLFIREESEFDNINPILGGIHLLFPNFNMNQINMPYNGFARLCKWECPEEPYTMNNNIATEIELNRNDVMRGIHWDNPFTLNLNVVLGLTTLTTVIGVFNASPDKTIHFNLAMETLFRIRSIKHCQIYGLQNNEYIDHVKCVRRIDDDLAPLIITERIDRIYPKVKRKVKIIDLLEGRKIIIKKVNFPDICVLNPWIGEYEQMISVIPGYIASIVKLPPNEWFYAGQRIEILPLLPDQQIN